ncbi:YeiH family protein [Lapidilactobacillus luobeiensis]|uniref:YeiH family protein n=1 Tax=Lapidilactobacillus luobeiensis TaxID=2950371 RepID=UPI0021C2AB14|nr:putative sulfate exporter family transporter [Lapidilactobacillus luobeiensis]
MDLKVLRSKSFVYAFLITLFCSVVGSVLGSLPYLSVIGALVLALILGMIFQVFPTAVQASRTGNQFISNKFLRLGIILLGFKLNLIELAQAGVKTILLAMAIVAGTISLTYWLARKFGVSQQLAILAASGTGICGAAAVMGISSQIPAADGLEEQKHDDEVLAVAIVAILGTVFTLIEIGLRPILHLTPTQFGVMAGGSLHEIAHAVATGGANGPVSLNAAIIMKLSRVLMLAPAALIIGIWYQRQQQQTNAGPKKLPIPWFMLGFVLASVAGTFLPLSATVLAGLVKLAYLILGMAMAALGISVNFKVFWKSGRKAVLACLISSTCLLGLMIVASKLLF